VQLHTAEQLQFHPSVFLAVRKLSKYLIFVEKFLFKDKNYKAEYSHFNKKMRKKNFILRFHNLQR